MVLTACCVASLSAPVVILSNCEQGSAAPGDNSWLKAQQTTTTSGVTHCCLVAFLLLPAAVPKKKGSGNNNTSTSSNCIFNAINDVCTSSNQNKWGDVFINPFSGLVAVGRIKQQDFIPFFLAFSLSPLIHLLALFPEVEIIHSFCLYSAAVASNPYTLTRLFLKVVLAVLIFVLYRRIKEPLRKLATGTLNNRYVL